MKINKVIYTDDAGEMDGFDGSHMLSPAKQKAAGIPSAEQAAGMRLVRKVAKETRINVRLSGKTLAGLKARAEEAGMPYQTLAASVLHMVATGKLRLELVGARRGK